MKRTLINQTGGSNKFWIAIQEDTSLLLHWGKIGTEGRRNTKAFANADLCQQELTQLIKKKLSSGYQEIADLKLAPEKPTAIDRPMNESVFWEIIALFNWKKTGDDDLVLKPAIKALSSMTIDDIHAFEEILAEKLYQLDGPMFASRIGEDAYREGTHFSPDLFLYARCCVVANGQKFFEKMLADPTAMPQDMEFEALLSLAEEAYDLKTDGEEYDPPITCFSYETFSNNALWGNIVPSAK